MVLDEGIGKKSMDVRLSILSDIRGTFYNPRRTNHRSNINERSTKDFYCAVSSALACLYPAKSNIFLATSYIQHFLTINKDL